MSRNREIEMARYLAGEMSVKEEIAFFRETEKSQEQLEELKNMEKNWKYFDQNPSEKDWNSEEAWQRLHQKLDSEGLLEDQRAERGRNRFAPMLRVAASIALVLAIAVPALYFGVLQDKNNEAIRYFRASEGTATVDLPDGSRVFLNKGAELSYPKAFKSQRTVELSGEAFFEVMSDPRNPFTVYSGEMFVTVLGTSFNVKQLESSSDVEIYVKTGKVRVSLKNSGEFIQLEQEEFGIVENRTLSSTELNDPNYISWKTKDFKFVNSALVEVLRELEESFHVEIHAEGVDLSEKRITTSYSEQSIDAILETIGTAFDLNISRKEKGYILTR